MPKTPTATQIVAADAGSSTSVEGSITLDIAGEQFTLTGQVGTYLKVKYHREFSEAINLGTIENIADGVGKALGAPGIKERTDKACEALNGVPALTAVFKVIKSASVRITDLEIDTETKTYQFGFALDFTTSDPQPKIGDIALVAFGLKVAYQASDT